MTALLKAIGKHGLELNDIELNFLAEEIIKELHALNLFIVKEPEEKEEELSEDERIFEYDITYHAETRAIHINISTPYRVSVDIYPDAIVFSTSYSYSLLHQPGEAALWEQFREELYEVMRIFHCEEVIYLPGSATYPLAAYLGKTETGMAYDAVKVLMLAEQGEPVKELNETSRKRFEQDENTWYLDDFADIRKEYEAPEVKEYHKRYYDFLNN